MSHYRLAAHLMLAVTGFGYCVWFANDRLARPQWSLPPTTRRFMLRALAALGALLAIQIFWSALVAGLKAGFIHGTFPLMDGRLLPPNGWSQEPWPLSLVENMATVQWVHRVLATVLLVGAIALLVKVRRIPGLARFRRWSAARAGLVALQHGLGVTRLLTHVRTPIAETHQATALLIVGVLVVLVHRLLQGGWRPSDAAPGQGPRG